MGTYDVWAMTHKNDRRVARYEALCPAITRAKEIIKPRNYIRIEHWIGTTMTVAWDSLDGNNAVQQRKSQLRDFIRKPHRRPAGGLR